MAVVPLLARDLGADMIGHDRPVVGQVADRKPVGLEPPGAGAQDDAPGPEEMNPGLIDAETGGPGNLSLPFDQVGDHDSLDYRYVAFFYGPAEGIEIEGRIEKAPRLQFPDPVQGMLGHLPGKYWIIGPHGRTGNRIDKLVETQFFPGRIVGKNAFGKRGLPRCAQPPLGHHQDPGAGIMGFDRGEKAGDAAAHNQYVGLAFGRRYFIRVNFRDVDAAFAPPGG
jgi:hypothetical protein